MKPSILDKIVSQKKEEILDLKKNNYKFKKLEKNKNESFFEKLNQPRLNLIAEVKKASPSAGIIRENFDPVELAQEFINSGAAALSVLTDEKFFMGHLNYLKQIRHSFKCPILRKDFILDPIQIQQAAECGASAILLILSILTYKQAQILLDCAAENNLDVLIEVHDEKELEILLKLKGVKIIGFNNRNLNTFKVDIRHSLEMKRKLMNTHLKNCLFIAESGYKTIEELDELAKHKFNGVLIGEGLALSAKLGNFFL